MQASARRCGSSAQLSGRYNRQLSTAAPSVHTSCKLTATWQFAVLPSVPEYWRSTPTECEPCFGKPVSSITHIASGSNSLTIRPANRSHTGSQSHGLCPTNCCIACSLPSGKRLAVDAGIKRQHFRRFCSPEVGMDRLQPISQRDRVHPQIRQRPVAMPDANPVFRKPAISQDAVCTL